MDLSEAFDSISHNQLSNIFKSIGIVHKPFNLLKYYLFNKKQLVRINNTLSNELEIKNGVPQGTVISPIFYIIYVSALGKLKLKGKLFSYADDTALIISKNNWEIADFNAESC